MEYDKIKQLMEDMGNSKLTSIDIDFADGTKIKMTKQNNQTTKDNYFVEKNNNNQEKIENLQGIVEENFSQKTDYPEKTKEKNNIVKSPMVGTFYLKPSPTSNSVDPGLTPVTSGSISSSTASKPTPKSLSPSPHWSWKSSLKMRKPLSLVLVTEM